jgi:hypothetical protein
MRALILATFALIASAPVLAEPLALASSWSAYGEGFAAPSVSIEDGIVVVGGLARASSPEWGTIATLPAQARPPRRLTFSLDNHGKSSRLDVFPDGRIAWIQGSHDHGWVSLDGIRFVVKPDAPLALPSGWVSYSDVNDPGVYERPSASKRGDRIVLSGTVLKRAGNVFQSGETIATLPGGMRPPVPLIFNANGGTQVQRIDAYPDGRIVWVGGGHDYPWVSLDGLVFPLNTGTALAPGNGWAAYGRGQAAPAAVRAGNTVLLSGLLTGEGPRSQHIMQLPAGMRPAGRRIFHTGADQYSLRVDIDADGWLSVEAGAGTGWVTLSGIAFPVAAPVVAAAPSPVPAVTAMPVGAMQRQPLQLASGWTPYGQGYSAPTATKSGNVVMVNGLARASSSQWGLIATLPAGWRPPHELVFNLNNDADTARVDVLPDGRVLWIAGGHDHGWLSLSGITFSTERGTPLALGTGWRDFGPAYHTAHGPASATRIGDLVVVSGLIEKPAGGIKPGDLIATLPEGARPAQSLIFNVNGESKTQRVDIAPDGRIYWTNGGHDYNWVSLDGITFSARPGTNLALAPGNARYDASWAGPQVARVGDMVSISGLIRPGNLDQPVAVLPPELRPSGRMIFNLGSDGNPIRIDIAPNGEVRHAAGTRAIGWLNLSGIAYPLGIAMPQTVPSNASLDAARSLAAGLPGLKSDWKDWEKLFRQEGELFRADVRIADQPATIVVYRPIADRLSVNIAVLASNLTVGHLIKPAEGTPADDLVVDNAAYIFVPGGSAQSMDVSQLPPIVRDQVAQVRTGPIDLVEGQNLFALVNARDGGTTAQLFRLIGAPLDNLKVNVAYGRRKVKDKTEPYNDVRLTRAGAWGEPFHLKDTELRNPTFELAKRGNERILRAWGEGTVRKKDYFVFLQKTGARGPFPTAAALDASSISLKEYTQVAMVLGETVLGSAGAMQDLLDGIDQVPLDQVRIENPGYRAGGAMDADNNPVLYNVLVMAAAPGDTLPDAAKTAGPILLAHGEGKVFGFTAGAVNGWIRSTKGMDMTASVKLPKWNDMNLGDFAFSLYRDGRRYAMELKGKAYVPALVDENITIKANNHGFVYALGASCPLRPLGISASVDGYDIGHGSGFKISKASGNPLDCILGPLGDIAAALRKGIEAVPLSDGLVKAIDNDAWAGLVKLGGGAISPDSLVRVSKDYANPSKALSGAVQAGKQALDDVGDSLGGFLGGSSSGGEKPRYFIRPSDCGSNDEWNIKWGTCWRKGHQLVRLANNGKFCLSVDGRKKEKNRDVQLEICHGDWNQQWRWYPATGELRHGWGADGCLDSGAKETSSPGRKLEQNACNGEGDQRFYRDVYDRLVDRDGYCIEAETGKADDVTLRVQPCKLDASGKQATVLQRWDFSGTPASSFKVLSAAEGCSLVGKGRWNDTYKACLNPGFDALQLAAAGGLCLGVRSDGDSNDDPVTADRCHYRWSEQWQYKEGRIANPIGKCLDYDKSIDDVKAGEHLLQRKCEGRSQWGAYRIADSNEYLFKSRSGYCLAVSASPGSDASLQYCNAADSRQRFRVGAPRIWQAALDGQRAWCDADQRWRINTNFCVEQGYRLLQPKASPSLCARLDEDEKGDDVRLYPCGGASNSEWKPLWKWNGKAIKHKKGLCMDVQGSKAKNGAHVQGYNCKDEAYQRWSLDSAGVLWGIGGTCVGLEDGYQKNSKLVLRTRSSGCVHWTFD